MGLSLSPDGIPYLLLASAVTSLDDAAVNEVDLAVRIIKRMVIVFTQPVRLSGTVAGVHLERYPLAVDEIPKADRDEKLIEDLKHVLPGRCRKPRPFHLVELVDVATDLLPHHLAIRVSPGIDVR